MAKPIPKRLLIHKVKFRPIVGNDGWNDIIGDPIEVEGVRVEPTHGKQWTELSEGTRASHIVIIDRTNSKPFIRPTAGSQLKWDDDEYTISRVRAFYDTESLPHHYEVELL